MDAATLPSPTPGYEWREVKPFQPGAELLNNPDLNQVFRAALQSGSAIVGAPDDR